MVVRQQEPEDAPACVVSLKTIALVSILRSYDYGRREAYDKLLGRRYKPSALRDELIRCLILDQSNGTPRTISEYEKSLAQFASRPAVREEVRRLAAASLVILHRGKVPGRGTLAHPSQRLVDWYASQIPDIVGFLRAMDSLSD